MMTTLQTYGTTGLNNFIRIADNTSIQECVEVFFFMLEIIEENPLESEENMGKGQEKAGQKSSVKGEKQEEEPQKEQQQEKAEKKGKPGSGRAAE